MLRWHKNWAGDFIDMSILLKSTSQLHDYADDGPFGGTPNKKWKVMHNKAEGVNI
jgi:hypothetical protein